MKTNDEKFMRTAIQAALDARANGNEPFGAVLVKDDTIVMIGENNIAGASDPTAHAELGLIRDFCRREHVSNLADYTLYTSCEPCVMCSGAMVWSNLGKVVYSVSHDQLAAIAGSNILISCSEVFAKSPHQPIVVKELLNIEGLAVFDGYSFSGHE